MIDEIEGFFYNDPPIPSELADTISILNEFDAGKEWDRYVSGSGRHFMLLTNSDWPAQVVSHQLPFYHWLEDWNAHSFQPFANELELRGPGNASEEVIVFWMREHAIRTIWSTFRDHWINFLYEDEGVLVVLPRKAEVFVLSNGHAWGGHHEAQQVSAPDE